MTLQMKTLQRYRQFYPQDTLREVSARTGIQITRVFRLFGGKTMKVGELEAFEKAIGDKAHMHPGFFKLNFCVEKAASVMTNEELVRLAEYIQRKITARAYQNTYSDLEIQNTIIA